MECTWMAATNVFTYMNLGSSLIISLFRDSNPIHLRDENSKLLLSRLVCNSTTMPF